MMIMIIKIIQTDHLISTRRPDIIIINNNNNKRELAKFLDFADLADHRIKLKETEKKDKYLNFVTQTPVKDHQLTIM